MFRLDVTHQELATIRAALCAYQDAGGGDPEERTDVIHELATDHDTVISLDDKGIAALIKNLAAIGPRHDD